MGPDKYKQGHYDTFNSGGGKIKQLTSTFPGTPAPEMDLDAVLNAVKKSEPMIDNAFIPSLTGIKIVVNEQMNPNDCTLVVGTEYYRRLRQAIENQDEKTDTKD